jgi:hypothetical protein
MQYLHISDMNQLPQKAPPENNQPAAEMRASLE